VAKLRNLRPYVPFEPDPNFKPDPASTVDPIIQEICAGSRRDELLAPEDTVSWEAEEEDGVDYREFWQRSKEIWSIVPQAEWDSLPRDLSVNLDHYLYGTPKQVE